MKELVTYIKEKYPKNSTNLVSYLESTFLEDELYINEILNEENISNAFKLECYMDTFLGVYIQKLTIFFFEDKEGELQCIIEATLPSIWNYSWIYFDLPKYSESKEPLFEFINFAKPARFIYSSSEYEESQKEFIGEFINEEELKCLKKGENYFLKTDILNILFKDKFNNLKIENNIDTSKFPTIVKDAIENLKGMIDLSFIKDIKEFFEKIDILKDATMYGYVKNYSYYDTINIDISFKDKIIDTSYFSLDYITLFSSTNRFKNVSNGVKFIGSIKVDEKSYKIELEYYINSTTFVLKIVDELKLLNLKEDSGLAIKNLDALYLKEFSLGVSFGESIGLSQLNFDIGSKNFQQSIIGESFKIDDFVFGFEYYANKQNDYKFYTQCDLLVGGGLVHLGASYPSKEFYGELGLYQSISIDSIMKDIFYIDAFPKIDILDLSLSSNFETKTHSFMFELASDWSFEILQEDFELLKRVFVKVDWDETHSIFLINSTMIIADLEILLMAINVKENNGESETSKWEFEGRSGEDSVILIGDFASKFLSYFKLDGLLPDFLRKLELKDVGAKFNTDTKESSFYGTVETVLFEKETSFELKVDTEKKSEELYDVTFTSKLIIGSQIFDGVFINKGKEEKLSDTEDEKVIFKASWSQKDDGVVGLNDILEFMGIESFSIPKEIDLGLKKADIVFGNKGSYRVSADSINYGKLVFVSYKKDNQNIYFLGVNIDHTIDLTNLPLVNQVFDEKHKLAIEDIKIVYSSGEFEQSDYEKINGFITDGYAKIDKETEEGFALSLNLNIAGHKELLSLSTSKEKATKQIENKSEKRTTSESKALVSTSDTKTDVPTDTQKEYANDGTLWYKLGKKLGPVSFEKIGLKYDEGRLYISINSSLSASGLNIDLIQASISTKLDEFTPRFDLKGLGVGYGNSSFELTGTLITKPSKDYDSMEYTGGAVLKTKGFALEAFGSYYDSKDNTSMFIFVEVDRVFGGPPSFVLTGILGGFGYNSKLRIPDIDEMSQLPLISGLSDPSKIGKKDTKKATTPTQAIAKLTTGDKPWVTPKAGNIWVAAGIKFTSFELMNSVALVVGEFGKEFSLGILGRSKGIYPKKAKKPFVNFELDLRAYFNPNMGELSFIAKLSNGSYILDKDCHITGGFAMCFWFGDNAHSGDFVISMGGYSPYFSKPEHYPQLDRVGVNWKVSSDVSIKGGQYFAVTPSAAMVGGNIQILFDTGSISAWVKAKYDVIVWWNPFYFVAEVCVRVGAAVKVIGRRISVELGCMLGLWGSGFGGKVKVKILFIITFTISFGSSKKSKIDKLTWDQFKESLPDSQKYIKIVPLDGVVPKASMENEDGESINDGGENSRIIVKPNRFAFKTESQIPNSKVVFGNSIKANSSDDNENLINIKPMGEKKLNSIQTIKVTKLDGEDDTSWVIEENIQNVPESLWGEGSQTKLVSQEEALISSPIGFIIKAPTPNVSQYKITKILVENISYSTMSFDKSYLPITHPFDSNGKKEILSYIQDNTIEKIEKIAGNSTRNDLHNSLLSLGFELDNDSMDGLASEFDSYFTDSPMVKKV